MIRIADGNPLSGLYKTAEGAQVYLIGADAVRHWPNTVRALDKPEWLDDDRFQYARDRREHLRRWQGDGVAREFSPINKPGSPRWDN